MAKGLKVNGKDWLGVILANNPDCKAPELNPRCPKWFDTKRLNNPLAYDFPSYFCNPADSEHELWFEWCCIGMECFKKKSLTF